MGFNRDQIVDMYQTRMRSLMTSIQRDQEEQDAIAYNAAVEKRAKDQEFYAKMQLGLGIAGMAKDLRESYLDRRMGETYGDPLGASGILPKKYEFKKGFHPFSPLKETEGYKEFQRDIPNKQILDKIEAGVEKNIYTQEQFEQAKINAKSNPDKFNADHQAGSYDALVSTEAQLASKSLERKGMPVVDTGDIDEHDYEGYQDIFGDTGLSREEYDKANAANTALLDKSKADADIMAAEELDPSDAFPRVAPEYSQEQLADIQEGRNKALYEQWTAKQNVHPERVMEYDQWKAEVESGGISGVEIKDGTVFAQPERPNVPIAEEEVNLDEFFNEDVTVDDFDDSLSEFEDWEEPPPPSSFAKTQAQTDPSVISPIETKIKVAQEELPSVLDATRKLPVNAGALKGQEWGGLNKGYQPKTKTTGLEFQESRGIDFIDDIPADSNNFEAALKDLENLKTGDLPKGGPLTASVGTSDTYTSGGDVLGAPSAIEAPDVKIPDAKPTSLIAKGFGKVAGGVGTLQDIQALTAGGGGLESDVKKTQIASKLGGKAIGEKGVGKLLSTTGKVLGAGLGIFGGLKTAFDEDATDVQRFGGGMQAIGSGLLASGIGAPIGALLTGLGSIMNLFGGGGRKAPVPVPQKRKVSADLGRHYRRLSQRRGMY